MATYMLPTRGFYRAGVFYRPGDPFEIPDDQEPQRDAVLVSGVRKEKPKPKVPDTFSMSDLPKAKRTSDV